MIMSDYRKYQCSVCGHIYDEEEGDEETGIAPGTRWEDIPDDWRCPECGAEKSEYALMV
jgi:rubredoxin